MNDSIQHLIEAVQKASPIVWQAAQRQVYIDGVECCCAALLCAILSIVLFKRAQKMQMTAPFDDSEVAKGVTYGVAILAAFLIIPATVMAIDLLMNPTFAAIKNLKGLL